MCGRFTLRTPAQELATFFDVAGIPDLTPRYNIAPTQMVAPIHDRMPVILSPDDYGVWLDPEFEDKDKLQELLKPYAGDDLEAYPVSTIVNSPKNDVEECVRGIAE